MQVFTILPIIPYTLSLATGSVGIFCVAFYLSKLSMAYCASDSVNFSPASEISWS